MQAVMEAKQRNLCYAAFQLMPRRSPTTILTERDKQVLHVLARGPHTVEQLLKVSGTWREPFTSARYVQKRMQRLSSAGWVRSWRYATTSRGALAYYKLTRTGFRLFSGPYGAIPTRSFFDPVSMAMQTHTMALMDFIVHTDLAACMAGVKFRGFHRENALKLMAGDESVYPDCAFRLVAADGQCFNFVVEIDNGTERLRTHKDDESWQRKIRLYDQYQDQCPERFRVLIVTTTCSSRLQHILDTARQLVRNPRRSLFYGTALPEYLRGVNSIHASCFLNHRGQHVAIVPAAETSETCAARPTQLAPAAVR